MNSMKLKTRQRQIVITVLTAVLFFAVTMPFRRLFQVVSVTEVRPASAFNPLFGLIFGFPGALGCAAGNLVADILSGYSPLMCLLGFFVQIIYGIAPYWIWKHFRCEARLNTARNVLRYMLVMLADSLLTAVLLGMVMAAMGMGKVLSMVTLMLFLNNFVFCMVLGIPILLAYTAKRLKGSGDRFSLNEQFILIFLFLAILSAAMIGLIAYRELNHYIADPLSLWNRIYIYIAANLFVFCIVIVFFLRYAEDNITVPMEKLAALASDYIKTEANDRLNTQRMVEQCSEYIKVHGEVGALAEAFRDMSINLERYIDNLTRITAEKERISAELNVATQIQADMLPNIFPAFPQRNEFAIYASMHPAKEVGGDFYDFFLVDPDHLALVVADVSGKGVPAALFMVISKTLLKNQVLMGTSPKDVLEIVNNQLCENNEAEMFVTAWLGILEISTGKLTAANAGHEYPAIKRENGEFELYKDKHGFVLAGMEKAKYREYELQFNPGDTLFVYTDGVVEATDSQNRLYKTERMLRALNQRADDDPQGLIQNVKTDIDEFVGQAMQFDDITMLAITYYGPEREKPSLRLPATIENWEKVYDFITRALDEVQCPGKEKIQIQTAAEEIYVNVAHYAYPGKTGEVQIDIDVKEDPRRVAVIVRDSGIPYNPLEKEDADITLSAEERKIGGLGILMVKKSMDEVSYAYAGGQNRLTMTKIIEPAKHGNRLGLMSAVLDKRLDEK